jgi:hypothetical protein
LAVTTDETVIALVARITNAGDRVSALGTEASTVVPLSIDTGVTVPLTGAMNGDLFGGRQMTLESVIIGAQRGEAGVKVTGETGQTATNHGTATCRLGDMANRGIATTRIIISGGD